MKTFFMALALFASFGKGCSSTPQVKVKRTTTPAAIITTTICPAIIYGMPYVCLFKASATTPPGLPYTWNLSGTLPQGLSFSDASYGYANLSGTVLQAISPFTITVSLSTGSSVALTIGINNQSLTVTTSSCPMLTLGQAYQCQLSATGGTPPYHWSSTTAPLPGLTFSDGGLLSGTVIACSATVTINCVQFSNPPQQLQILLAGKAITIPVQASKRPS